MTVFIPVTVSVSSPAIMLRTPKINTHVMKNNVNSATSESTCETKVTSWLNDWNTLRKKRHLIVKNTTKIEFIAIYKIKIHSGIVEMRVAVGKTCFGWMILMPA